MKSKNKNADLELARFLMIIAVAVLHFTEDYVGHSFISGGYLGVDFFLTLSGFFLMFHYEREKKLKECKANCNAINEEGGYKSFTYIRYRIKQLYKPYIISILLYVGLSFWENNFNLMWLINHFWETKWQYLFLHYLGADVPFEFRSIWFMSSLIILSYLIYFLLNYNEELYLGLTPVAVILIYVWIFVSFHSLSMQWIWTGKIHGSVIRGFAGMSLGVWAAWYVLRVKEGLISCNIKAPNIIKVVCFLLIFYVMLRWGFDTNDFIVLPAMLVLVIVCYLYPFKLSGMLHRIIIYFGSLSYWIFLLHLLISRYMLICFPGRRLRIALPLFLGLTIVLSALVSMIVEKLKFSKIKRNRG